MRISIVNGPNLNILGKREPGFYGFESFGFILEKLQQQFPSVEFDYFQSNMEGEIITKLQSCEESDGIILNAAAYTHTSIAIADTVAAIQQPVVEVHISNIFSREEFRHHSYISPHAKGVICGFGLKGYILAVHYFLE